MSTPTPAQGLPAPEALSDTFYVYDVDIGDEEVRYYGEPLTPRERVVERLAPQFRERGYRVTLQYDTGEYVLIARERSLGVDGVPWANVLMLAATVLTTLGAGALWYGLPVFEDPLVALRAWPFTLGVLGILGTHELGHYALSRHHEVEASLPYFIPIPNPIGTLGAVIRMRDHLPSRTALFDIGVAGPLAGLVTTIVVATIGVLLPPVDLPAGALVRDYQIGFPLLIQGIAALLGEPLYYAQPGRIVNPLVVAAWVGAFVTFLNLIPVGQLDGAHVTRALIGDWLDRLQLLVPFVLWGIAGFHILFGDSRAAFLWGVWGLFALVFSRVGGADPIDDTPVGRKRQAVAVVALALGLLCFSPAPIVFTG
jgi:membrane-associated protease RseP (regulator of RpoE activity)